MALEVLLVFSESRPANFPGPSLGLVLFRSRQVPRLFLAHLLVLPYFQRQNYF